MKIIHKSFKSSGSEGDWVLLIGNFDGFHLGHQALIKALLEAKSKYNAKAAILSFDPHPKVVLQPHVPFQHIYDEETKWCLMEELGLDACFLIPFTPRFAGLTPKEFTEKLFALLSIKQIIVGYDFNFGRDRSGGAADLKEGAKAKGVEFTQLEPVKLDRYTISSTMIRRLLYEAEFAQAENLLGRPWRILGEVQKGAQLGRTIGFPTINILPPVLLPVRFGVYVVEVELRGNTYKAVCNIGHAPTFGLAQLKVEAHIFDFDQEVYGQMAKVKPLAFIRDEEKFESKEALTVQIAKDVEIAKNWKS
ncbi:MAG: bifunctional riboflavin kinase/FAD synthetase [SAR324 cluster bacterium]|nr:bifunctional riboflavin kinase/FAD synthetase [SAR324 cluster bacterium]